MHHDIASPLQALDWGIKKTIVILDDFELIHTIWKDKLKDKNITLISFFNAKEFEEYLKEQKPFNKQLSSKRMLVENIIRFVKIFKITTDKYRNRKKIWNKIYLD
jgi:hypothetical protein